MSSKNGYGKHCLINEIMCKEIIVTKPWDSVTKAAKLILNNKIHGIGVSLDNVIVGIISEGDILKTISKKL